MNSSSKLQRAVHRVSVIGAREVAPNHYQLKFHAPQLANKAAPGQFVHVLTMPNATNWHFDPLLRRAFSIMSVEKEQQQSFDVLFRVEGRGTQNLAKAQAGDEIDMIGPLGQPFDLSPLNLSSSDLSSSDLSNSNVQAENAVFHVKQSLNSSSAIVVGGGVGVPPLVYLSEHLAARGVSVRAIIGARGAKEIVGFEELRAVCDQVVVTTDDGSCGHAGRVTDKLPVSIEQLSGTIEGRAIKPVVYACGPLPMLRAVAQLSAQMGVRCQVSLEENMPCGIGVCNGCVVGARRPFTKVSGSDERGLGSGIEQEALALNETLGNEWSPYRGYRRVCVEGPACWADEIDWESV